MKQRVLEPEWMDDPAIDPQLHEKALVGLQRINQWSFSREAVWSAIRKIAAKNPGKPLRILDLATGGGDNPLALAAKAQRAGLPLHFEGCDRSATAVAYAQRQADACGLPVRFFQWDVCENPLPAGYDIIINSLFLHHLDETQTVSVLRKMAAAAEKAVLVNDLTRHWAGLWLAILGTRLLSSSPVVHEDGPQSVRAAYTLKEIRSLAEQAGLNGFKIQPQWPFRYLLSWERA